MSIKFSRNQTTVLHYVRTWMAWKAAVFNRTSWQQKVDTLCRDTTTTHEQINEALVRLRQTEALAAKLWNRRMLIHRELIEQGITLIPQ